MLLARWLCQHWTGREFRDEEYSRLAKCAKQIPRHDSSGLVSISWVSHRTSVFHKERLPLLGWRYRLACIMQAIYTLQQLLSLMHDTNDLPSLYLGSYFLVWNIKWNPCSPKSLTVDLYEPFQWLQGIALGRSRREICRLQNELGRSEHEVLRQKSLRSGNSHGLRLLIYLLQRSSGIIHSQ